MAKTTSRAEQQAEILEVDFSSISHASADQIIKIAKEEARRALAHGASPMLKDHLVSEGVLAGCKAYCRHSGNGSIFGYARTAMRNKMIDELRREYDLPLSESGDFAEAKYGAAADALNLGRRENTPVKSKGERTDGIDALNRLANKSQRRTKTRTAESIRRALSPLYDPLDLVTFGKAAPLPPVVEAVTLGCEYKEAAAMTGMLQWWETQSSATVPAAVRVAEAEKLKAAVKKVENTVLEFRAKSKALKNTARKPLEDETAVEYWPHAAWTVRNGKPKDRLRGTDLLSDFHAEALTPGQMPNRNRALKRSALQRESRLYLFLPGGNRRLGTKSAYDLLGNTEYAALVDARAEILYQAWCKDYWENGLSCVELIVDPDARVSRPRAVQHIQGTLRRQTADRLRRKETDREKLQDPRTIFSVMPYFSPRARRVKVIDPYGVIQTAEFQDWLLSAVKNVGERRIAVLSKSGAL